MKHKVFQYPGVRAALDGNEGVIRCERESTDAAGAFPITPSTQMGEHWAEEVARGHINTSGRPLIFIEPEGEHAAAAVTAGLSMTGLRAANFSSSQGIAYMHESLYAAVGKRLTYVLNMGCRALSKASLSVHASHDDYHCVDDTGFFQVFGRDVQQACDLNIIAHRIAELSLTPGIVAQDGFLTTHVIESFLLPERELIAEYLGRPDDVIDSPTPAQVMIYGPQRRRIPELWTVDNPMMAGIVQNQDAYMQSVAAQRPYFFDHIPALSERAFQEFYDLTGRKYARVLTYRCDDADYLILGQGSLIPTAEAVADHLRRSRRIKVGVVNLVMFRPFPGDLLGPILAGKKGVAVLERTDQPLAEDLPVAREIRAVISKCIENGRAGGSRPYPQYASYGSFADVPELFSAACGLGGRDLQPEGIVAAVENMLPDGAHRKFFYLGIDFIRAKAFTPKEEAHQDRIVEAYPEAAKLAVHGSENPNLMPEGSITARFHSVGGWGAITTGKNMAVTLFELLGYHIKAHPKYGSEKKGQPTTYYLSAAPEPIRVNCEYHYVDAVLSPDPNVFEHTNPLAGLRRGGTFIIQSAHKSPELLWNAIPDLFRKIILENEISVYYLDAFRIAREEATDPELEFRMQGIAFQGAFFAAVRTPALEKLSGEELFAAIREQLEHKFGGRGARVVEDNLRVVRRGFKEAASIPPEVRENAVLLPGDGPRVVHREPALPLELRRLPSSTEGLSDIHRFWEQTGSNYARGLGDHNLADPFMALSVMPPVSGVFRDMTAIRFEHPAWNPEKCTGCAKCWTICPDTAIPGVVNSVGEVLNTAVTRLEKRGARFIELRRSLGVLENKFLELAAASPESASVRGLMKSAGVHMLAANGRTPEASAVLASEFELLETELLREQFALTRPFFTLPEHKGKGSGGLLSLSINPTTCKGCAECVQVCPDDALTMVRQTTESTAELRDRREFWLDLPNTDPRYIRIDDLEGGVGVLETMLLDKAVSGAVVSGDGACLGCSEKTVARLFVGTVEALMRPRVVEHVRKLEELLERLEKHVEVQLLRAEGFGDASALREAAAALKGGDVTLARLAEKMASIKGEHPLDPVWLDRVTGLLAGLRDLHRRYTQGVSGRGRASMGMLNSTGCTSVWGSSWPYNPYPFPWANHLFQDSASMAMGVFEGHMVKMADGFRLVRKAELELEGKYDPETHDEQFQYFNWRDFSDEEFFLCPPVVALGGDGSMYDIGFQNLSRALMSGRPLKILIMDTQVYSNTGGQACTSGFRGQISDMAAFGKAYQGKEEIRKEIALIGMAHRTTYVLQSNIHSSSHLLEGFIEGLRSRRPALFNVYCACQPEHGIPDDAGAEQARLALQSRAYPVFSYNPDLGDTAKDCFRLDGNPDLDADWARFTLHYQEDGVDRQLDLPMTFADFAVTETRFRKHFRKVPTDAWHAGMQPLAEYLELKRADREDLLPYIWAIDKKNQLSRLAVGQAIVEACEDRRQFWRMLRSLAGVGDGTAEPAEELAARIRADVIQKIAGGLLQMVGAEPAGALPLPGPTDEAKTAPAAAAGGTGAADSMMPYIDSANCTACDECMKINSRIFAYNADRKATIVDPRGGPYRDLVRAAEKCTAGVIHPGRPLQPAEKDVEKWMARGQKYN